MDVGLTPLPPLPSRLRSLLLLCVSCACAAGNTSGQRGSESDGHSERRAGPSSSDSTTASLPPTPASSSASSTTPAIAASAAPLAAVPLAAVPLAKLSPSQEARVDTAVRASIKRGEIPGAVVVVVRNKQVVMRRAYGLRSVKPRRQTMTRETVFDLASLTKPIATATAIMKLRERRKLALRDPVARHLPAFARGHKAGVTIEQLMLHSAGLPPANHLKHYRKGRGPALQAIYGLPIRGRPGRKVRYSDLGYIVLGELVEHLSGETLDAFAHKHIFLPLQMSATTFVPLRRAGSGAAQLAQHAAPTEQRAGQWLRGRVHDPRAALLGGVAGHAGLFGSADDLARFALMMLSGGQLFGKQVLSQDSVKLLMRPRRVGSEMRTLGYQLRDGGIWHTGFTGTSMWIDAHHGSAVILLASRLHPNGKGKVGKLRTTLRRIVVQADQAAAKPGGQARVQTGIDVLAGQGFAQLKGRRVGLVSNLASRSANGRTTIELLRRAKGVKLVALFSPEHGIAAKQNRAVPDGRDSSTGLPIYSLYGASKRPTATQLRGLDTLVFDLQDVGVRFYTYISTLGYLLEAAAKHHKRVVVLDRPNPIGGERVEGPLLDSGRESFIAYHRLVVRHGMTVGELAKMFNVERKLKADLQVIELTGWKRADRFDRSGLPWVNPSPNLRSLRAALLYPGIGLLEATNLSVGRGTDTPFEQFGAPWLNAPALVQALRAAAIDGLRVEPTSFTPQSSKFSGKLCRGIKLKIVDPDKLESVRLGVEIAHQLRKLHPRAWHGKGLMTLLGNQASFTAIMSGQDSAQLQASWQKDRAAFLMRRSKFLLY